MRTTRTLLALLAAVTVGTATASALDVHSPTCATAKVTAVVGP
jgi:hypothetical protein